MKVYLKIATIVGSLALVKADGFDEAKPGLRAHSNPSVQHHSRNKPRVKPSVQHHSRNKPRVKPRASSSVEKADAMRENPNQEKPKAAENHYSHVKQQGNPRSTCTTGDGWTDDLGFVCTWYEDNEPAGCPTWGYFPGANGLTADQACCHCQNVESTSCTTGDGWTDDLGFVCTWYETYEPAGCPTWGYFPGENGLTAGQACCHCQNVENLPPVSIRNKAFGSCIAGNSIGSLVSPSPCNESAISQQWNLVGNLIQSTTDPSQCLFPTADPESTFQFVILRDCSFSYLSGEFFFEDDNTIRHSGGHCLSFDYGLLKLESCVQGAVSMMHQQWEVI